MREYATQMEAGAQGDRYPPELARVAEKERMTCEELMPLVAFGQGGHLRQ